MANLTMNRGDKLILNNDLTQNSYVTLDASNSILIDNLGTECLRIDSGGKVGIGTTSPVLKLDVRGDSVIYSSNAAFTEGESIFYTGSAATGGGINLHLGAAGTSPGSSTLKGYLRVRGTSGNIIIGRYNAGTETVPFEIDNSNGNIGIGTSSPGDIVHVYSTVNAVQSGITVQNTNGASGVQLRLVNGNAGWNVAIPGSSSDLNFFDGTAQRVTFKLGGNVGIGTTNPGALLHVKGTIRIEDSTTPQLDLCVGATSQGSIFGTSDGAVVISPRLGYLNLSLCNVGIGIAPNAAYSLYLGGGDIRTDHAITSPGSPGTALNEYLPIYCGASLRYLRLYSIP